MNHILLLIANGASIDFGDPSPGTLLENMVAGAHKNEILNSPSLNDDTPVDLVLEKKYRGSIKKASKEHGDMLMNKQCLACGKINKNLLQCIQCYGAFYCGVKCQRSHIGKVIFFLSFFLCVHFHAVHKRI
jgi:hypothetical protein